MATFDKMLNMRTHKSTPRFRLLGEALEDRHLMAFDPSPAEQALLEHINRIRMEPQNELAVMFKSFNPLLVRDAGGLANNPSLDGIQLAVNFFQVNGTVLQQQFSTLTPVAPLAWNEALIAAADLHNGFMLARNDQQHHFPPQEKDLGGRLTDAGYNYSLALENIYAYSEDALYGHAGFVIDWGNGPNGIQTPPGHRNNIMNSQVQEVGISVLETPVVDPVNDVGPMLITQDFGRRANYQAQLLGVAWEDGFQDSSGTGFTGLYDPGEGFGNVTITAQGNGRIFTTTTMSAGGYQMVVPAGTYTVTVKGPSALSPFPVEMAVSNVVVGFGNVKVDFEARETNSTGNRRPAAVADAVTLRPNRASTLNLLSNDVDEGSINASTVQVWTQPQHGTVTINAAGVVTYTPATGYLGADEFQYVVADNRGAFSAPGSVTIRVEPIPGDANLDNRVDGTDLQIWRTNAFQTGKDWRTADFNGDRVTDGTDFHIWLSNRFAVVDAAFADNVPRNTPRAALAKLLRDGNRANRARAEATTLIATPLQCSVTDQT